ncbi:Transcription factor, FAR1-related protein [Ophiocordyceps camponoti-floridani]|uniref:Transcription factor, FAR1-related protein n=1 Tax=Ophiocordyceps camponoti-floridani TaxID=2030778 RepID=A0A8H4Q706_9HYPO|nr:Transcription factor, FAR1-related protein [Ophiocordyceps camponoti-floridani]
MESIFTSKFPSYEAAIQACDDVARRQGFALAIHSKRPNARAPTSVYLRCSKGRKFVSHPDGSVDESKRRRTKTQMTQCPYRLSIKKTFRGMGRNWVVSGAAEAHNHDFFPANEHRKYRNEVLAKHLGDIIKAYEAGLRPVLIAAQLHSRAEEDGEVELASISIKDINNALARHRQQQLASQTPETKPSPNLTNQV